MKTKHSELYDLLVKYGSYLFAFTLESSYLGLFAHVAFPQWGYWQEAAVAWLVVFLINEVRGVVR